MKSIYDQRKTFYIGNTMLDIYYEFDDFGPDHNPFLVYFNSFYGNGPAKSSTGESFVLKHNMKSGEYADKVLMMIRKQLAEANERLYAGAIDMWFAEGYCDEDLWVMDIYNWVRNVFDKAFLEWDKRCSKKKNNMESCPWFERHGSNFRYELVAIKTIDGIRYTLWMRDKTFYTWSNSVSDTCKPNAFRKIARDLLVHLRRDLNKAAKDISSKSLRYTSCEELPSEAEHVRYCLHDLLYIIDDPSITNDKILLDCLRKDLGKYDSAAFLYWLVSSIKNKYEELMKPENDISSFEKRLGVNHKYLSLPWEKTDEISCNLYVRLKATPGQIHELLSRDRERRHKMLKQLVEEGSFKLNGDSRISGEAIHQYNLEHPQRQYDEYESIEYTY